MLSGGGLPSLARLISCDAEVVPVTVDNDGNPLDVGRTRRLFTGPLRTALEVRDRGCAWPGCDRPVSWTQVELPGFGGQLLVDCCELGG